MKFLLLSSRIALLGVFVCFCIMLILKMDNELYAVPIKEVEESFSQWGILSHRIFTNLDIENHLLKVTDIITLRPGKGNFETFLNASFNIQSVHYFIEELPTKKIHTYVRYLNSLEDENSEEASYDESVNHDRIEHFDSYLLSFTTDLEFSLLKEYDLSKYYSMVTDDIKERYKNASILSIAIPEELRQTEGNLHIAVSYKGEIYDPPKRAKFSRENVADQTTGIIGKEGIYLSEDSHWYPTLPKELSTFYLEVTLPSEYEVMSEGDFGGKEVSLDSAIVRWNIPYPTENLHLVAGKYIVNRTTYNGIEVSTFFFPEEQHLSESYIQAVKKYLKMYEEMIGEYPYKKFSVVENFFPTGYGMPSFTLLGRQVIKLPFIIYTSLGHEVLHSWWGNSVFVDYDKGNWCEGLTTYLADYYYKEVNSPEAAEQYRREICRDYTNYVVQSGEDYPLKAFHERTTPATRAIGYGKTLMVFHMLREYLGDDIFYESLREFYERSIWKLASWEDLEVLFEEKSGKDLSWFFHQWIEKPGAPILVLEQPILKEKKGQYVVELIVRQTEEPYQLTVPIEIRTQEENKKVQLNCDFSGDGSLVSECSASVSLKAKPLLIEVDPYQDVFRKLYFDEIPAILSGVLGDKTQLVIIVPEENESLMKAYAEMASNLARTGKAKTKYPKELTDQDLKNNSVFILGNISKVEKFKKMGFSLPEDFLLSKDVLILNSKKYTGDAAILYTIKNPWNIEKTLAIFTGLTAEAVKASGRKLFHYGKYSYLAFQSGENKDKGVHSVKSSPLIYRFD